jgi:hypothetical protein
MSGYDEVACRFVINGGREPGSRDLDAQTFERATGISCDELVDRGKGEESLEEPVASDWDRRATGGRFFPEDRA